MGKNDSAPDQTPPKQTSAASTGTNVSTAIANAYLGNINENTPYGSTTFDKTGMENVYDSYTDTTYEIPTFTRNTNLSPEGQAIQDKTYDTELNLATLAADQSGFLQDYMNKPVNLNNDAVEDRLMELGRKRLDPALAERKDALATRLSNQGIKLGSSAYDRAMRGNTEAENDAYNQLLLGGRAQSINEILTERNQPMNEISAMMSGSQVNQPQFMGANMPKIPTTDNAGIIANYDQQKFNQWQVDQQNNQPMMGGLFGLGSGLLRGAFAFSDKRMKKDIKKVGKTNDGQNIYKYRYKSGGPVQMGLMAQEVEKKKPEAVITTPSGMKAVNYGIALGR